MLKNLGSMNWNRSFQDTKKARRTVGGEAWANIFTKQPINCMNHTLPNTGKLLHMGIKELKRGILSKILGAQERSTHTEVRIDPIIITMSKEARVILSLYHAKGALQILSK